MNMMVDHFDGGMDEPPMTVPQLIDRIVTRIEAASAAAGPDGQLRLEAVFPRNVYHELVAALPTDDLLDQVAPDNPQDGLMLTLSRDALARFEPEDQPFWQAMIEIFTAPEIAQAIAGHLGSARPPLATTVTLCRDMPVGLARQGPRGTIAAMEVHLTGDESNIAHAFATGDSSSSTTSVAPQAGASRNSIMLHFHIKRQEGRTDPMTNDIATAARAPAPSTPAHILNDVYDAQMSEALQTLARSFTRRDDVATLFREGGTGVELGVAAGDFSERILNRSKVGYLYSIDMWAGDRGHDMGQYRETIVRLAPHRARNAILRMRFDEALPLFEDHSLDFIYVDGYAHDGELNGQTFRQWYPKLRSGGIIAGDDYHADWPLVVSAVDAFIADKGLELHVIQCHEESWNSQYPTWFAMKP